MNKEVKEIKEYIESPFSARGGISYEQMQLIFDYINQLETNIDEAIGYIKYCQTSDKDIFPVIEAEKMIEILERGKE